MNTTEKALLLATLFPDILKELVLFIQEEIEHQRKYEKRLRDVWPRHPVTADDWFGIIQDVEGVVAHFNVDLHRSPWIFSDHLFHGHNAIFSIHCLIRYLKKKEQCPNQLKHAINLLFGDDILFVIDVR